MKTILLVLLLAATSLAEAQNRGLYIPGLAGLNSGVQAAPGFSYGFLYTAFDASDFMNGRGDEINIDAEYSLGAYQNLLLYTTGWTLFGAHYGLSVILFVAEGNISLERLDIGASATGFGDVYAEPVNLGWSLERAAIKFAYGIFIPVGEDGVTSDFWGHLLTLASTYYLDEQKLSQISINTVTEFHHKKQHSDLKVGNNFNLDLAVGKAFLLNQGKQVLQLGAAGYGQWQFTEDSGSDALSSAHDRVFGAGPEVQLLVTKWETGLVLRYQWEFEARNRAQGATLNLGVSKHF